MNAHHRLLLLIFSLILLVVSGVGALITIDVGIGKKETVTRWMDTVYADPQIRWPVLVISLLLILFTLHTIIQLSQNRDQETGVDRMTEFGHIRVSLKTLENLALQAGNNIKGIHNLSARVKHDVTHSSVGIGLKLTVDGDIPIQVLSEQLQQTVKTHVEEIAGVNVNKISVYIADTVQPDRTPVRID
ncbi:alkaline shock response membrane anchor protein AmaP [Desmospora activa]|uniref:Putative alkaline shock family protein YloU n=1 Tax=Desmospora activa DSM 45169 TaxID=1121389 RepID=A0A2T4Z9F7_9BACL|nr:alkaline shock response membrane anchor protein AmaP [Desmospora activa]PTM58528.1 putative alkaline shock family protein YloU [Desmospora activa DSM 45169]